MYEGSDAVLDAWQTGLRPSVRTLSAGVDLDLADLLARFPLPVGVPDAVMNRSQLARALQTSDNTITKWLARGMPCIEEGSNGRDYAFHLSHCYAWRMSVQEADRARRDAGDRAAAQLALHFRNELDDDEDATPVLSADQIIKESQADYQRNRAAELRRELVRASAVAALFEDILIQTRTQFVSLVDFAEMEFGLTPDQVRKLQMRCDGTLVQMRHEFGQVCPGEVVRLQTHVPLQGAAPAERPA